MSQIKASSSEQQFLLPSTASREDWKLYTSSAEGAALSTSTAIPNKAFLQSQREIPHHDKHSVNK